MKITDAQRVAWLKLPDSFVEYAIAPKATPPTLWIAGRRNDNAFSFPDKATAIDKAVEWSLDTDEEFRRANLFEGGVPMPPELDGAAPLVLYFETDEERTGFIEIVRASHPTWTARKV